MPEKLIHAEGNHSYQAGVDFSSSPTRVQGGPLPLTTVGDLPVLDGPVNTTLENGLLAGIAVNADPGSAGVRRAGVAAGRHGRVRHGKGSSHTSDRSLCYAFSISPQHQHNVKTNVWVGVDAAGPVGRVLLRRAVGERHRSESIDRLPRVALSALRDAGGKALLAGRDRKGRCREQQYREEGGDHGEDGVGEGAVSEGGRPRETLGLERVGRWLRAFIGEPRICMHRSAAAA
jgi:hypothetical protein